MAGTTDFDAGVDVIGMAQVRAMLKGLTPEMNAQIRLQAAVIGQMVVGKAKASSQSALNHQARGEEKTLTVVKDRTVKIRVGGAKRVFSSGAKAQDVVFATEFGLNPAHHGGSHGFNAHRGNGQPSYWLLPTIDAAGPAALQLWSAMVTKIVSDANSTRTGA